MKKNLLMYVCCIAALSFTFISCKSDPEEAPRARFTYEVTDLTVKFANNSTNAVKYAWNFGDGKNSTEQNPTHTFDKEGTYEVELIATNGSGATHSRKESIKVETASKVKITVDGNFSDWATVPAEYLAVATLDEANTNYKAIKEVKFCADDMYIYMYAKLDTLHNNAMDMYLNIDGSKPNGYTGAWMWDQPNADYLMQGFKADKYDMRLAKYDEAQAGKWGWLQPNVVETGSGLLTISQMKQVSGTVMEFEGKIVREFIPGLGDEIHIGVYTSGTPGGGAWDASGSMPTAMNGDKIPMLKVKLK